MNTKPSPSQHVFHVYRKSVWMNERASQHVMVPANKRLISMVMFSGERQKERETEREGGTCGNIVFSQRTLPWCNVWHNHRPKPPSHPHLLPKSGLQTRTATVLKINLYTNRLLIIINSSSSWCSLNAQISGNNSPFVVLFFCLLFF